MLNRLWTRRSPAISVDIQWMIRRMLPDVLLLEKSCFEFAWTEEDFLSILRQRHCTGMVAQHRNKVVGYMVYKLEREKLRVLNFAVCPSIRRAGVGTQMVSKLIGKLSQQCRRHIVLHVRETNLGAQLFFQSLGFLATGVLRDHYEDSAEDAYVMEYTLNECLSCGKDLMFCRCGGGE